MRKLFLPMILTAHYYSNYSAASTRSPPWGVWAMIVPGSTGRSRRFAKIRMLTHLYLSCLEVQAGEEPMFVEVVRVVRAY